jgi:hypothetical protein
VAEFLVELYVSRGDAHTIDGTAERARLAAEELSRTGGAVRYVRSIFVPEDETCFCLYEADSVESVREAARRAALPFERITEAFTETRDTK